MKLFQKSFCNLPVGFLLAFLICLLSLPGLTGFIWKDDEAMQKLENRKMATMPTWLVFKENSTTFIKELEKYLKDHVGYRRMANQIFRKIRYYVLKDPPLLNIALGRDGTLFLSSVRVNTPNVAFKELCEQQANPTDDLIQKMDNTFTSVSGYYASRGFKVTIAAAPTNISLYPDRLPRTVDKKYREACLAYPSSNHLLSRLAQLGQLKDRYSLYYPLDLFYQHREEPHFYPKETLHWSGRSAYLFARDLLRFSGVLDRLMIDDFSEPGDGADDMTMFFGFSRKIKVITYPYKKFNTTLTVPEWGQSLSKRGQFLHYTTSNSLSTKRCLLFSNSFGAGLAPHLAKGFKELYLCNLNHVNPEEEKQLFSRITEITKPDYIYVLFDEVGMIKAPERLGTLVELYSNEKAKHL